MFSCSICIIKIIKSHTQKESLAYATASSIAQEVLLNIRTCTAFHAQLKDEDRYSRET